MKSASSRSPLPLAAIAGTLVLAACGGNEPPSFGDAVAARVNGGEISMQQVEASLAPGRAGRVRPAAAAAHVHALERIIDEELLQERALRAGLDRLPQVQRSLAAARRQALAQAYLDWTAQAIHVQNRQDTKRFYRDNPALFEQRRIYSLNELAAAVPAESLEALRQATARAGSLEEVRDWLRARNLPYRVVSVSRSAEEIPLDVLPRLLAMREGQMVLVTGGPEVSVLELVHAAPAPMSEDEAIPVIERYFANRARLEVLQSEVRRLRAQATIEYVGKFALAQAALKQ
jgi:EpsD family peptidyl-prolyl cis-trans isomerase